MDTNTWVFDLEGDGLLDTVTRIWCGVFINVDTEAEKIFTHEHIGDMVHFMSTCDSLCAHNGYGYDFPALKKCYNYEYDGTRLDTLLMSRLQFPDRRAHSVESWGETLGHPKPPHDEWHRYSPEMLERCRGDARIQLGIYRVLMKDRQADAWKDAHKLTARVFEVLHEQEQNGWLIDREHMDKSIAQLTRWIDKIDEYIVPILPLVRDIEETKKAGVYGYVKKPFLKSGEYSASVNNWLMLSNSDTRHLVYGPFSRISYRPLNLNSVKEVKDFLLKEGWKPAQWNFKDGKRTSPKLSQHEPFDGITGKSGRSIAKRIVCRHRRSQLEGFVNHIRRDGRISQIISGQATTGRFKHSVIVNVPAPDKFFGKQMRRCFISKRGYSLVGTDSAGCQARMLAARVGDEQFTNTLVHGDRERGTSIHQINQQNIREIAGVEVAYSIAKNLNFGFMFGAQDPKLGAMAGGSPKLGKLIRRALLSISPGFEALVAELTREWKMNGGWITGLDGRPIVINSEHKILVFMLQSDEAIMMQYALLFLYKWCKLEKWKHGEEYGFVGNNHDEFQSEVRDDLVEKYVPLANRSITVAGEYLKIACPHVGESSVGYSWRDTH